LVVKKKFITMQHGNVNVKLVAQHFFVCVMLLHGRGHHQMDPKCLYACKYTGQKQRDLYELYSNRSAAHIDIIGAIIYF